MIYKAAFCMKTTEIMWKTEILLDILLGTIDLAYGIKLLKNKINQGNVETSAATSEIVGAIAELYGVFIGK
jgi:hypothetical protein